MRRTFGALLNWKVLAALAPVMIAVVALAPGRAWVAVPAYLLVGSGLSLVTAFARGGVVGPGLGNGWPASEAMNSRLADLQQDEARRLRR